jgi:hypothetical protein
VPEHESSAVWDANPAFLLGAVGIALALLAGLTSVTPEWDRLLLASGRIDGFANAPAAPFSGSSPSNNLRAWRIIKVMAKLLLAIVLTCFSAFAQPPRKQEPKNVSSASYLLHYAALRGETNSIEMMLKLGAEVNATDDQGKTPLHDACLKGHLETVRLLLDHGANIGARDKNDATPLHDAALGGAPVIIKLLLDKKADAQARDADGQTALDYAQKLDRAEAIRILKAVANAK